MTTNRCCVKCDAILDRGTYAGVDLDLCPECGGLWLDAGEIERIGKGSVVEIEELKRSLLGNPFAQPATSAAPESCPACSAALKEVVMGPVHVDFCRSCGGMWLDRGELEAGVAAAKGKMDLGTLLRVAASSAP